MSATPSSDYIQIWFHYEEIAMHFNQLLIQFRLQLLGGGVIGTLAAHFIGFAGKTGQLEPSEADRRVFRFRLSLLILLVFCAAAALDLCYYNQLLRGAVDELLRFEALHPDIQMSTTIEHTVRPLGYPAIYFAYALVAFVLCAFTYLSYRDSRPQGRKAKR